MTKNLLIVICSMLSLSVTAQFVDNFTDGNFTSNPVWSGDVSNFLVVNDTLKSNGPEATASIYLSTPSVAINSTTWEFSIKMDFAPSSSNQARVYLVSDNANLTGDLNGYYIAIGQSSDDQINFYRQDGASSTLLFGGSTFFTSSPVKVRIRVSRDDLGNWEVASDPNGGTSFISEGASFFDDTYTNTSFFGIVCKHTSTRRDLFYYDNITVTVPPDLSPPSLISILQISTMQLDLKFNEELELISAETSTNYFVDSGIGNPTSAVLDGTDNSVVHLTFSNPFVNNTNYSLSNENLEDTNGNVAGLATNHFTFLIPELAEMGDIVINEIFADPTPQVDLPEAEYVEIYNKSNKYIDLANFTLSESVITINKYIVAPGSYVILCDDSNEVLLNSFGEVIGVAMWNILTNTGETIVLKDENNGLVIDEVTYDVTWYNDKEKENGGYSLELVNPNSLCDESSNWQASVDNIGGTPGEQNSVFVIDDQAPKLQDAIAEKSDSLVLIFNEELVPDQIEGVFTISAGINITRVNFLNNAVLLKLEEDLQPGIEYSVSVSGLKDCSDNVITESQSIVFRLPDVPMPKDIIINELMADPFDQVGLPESEFVELYNRTDKYFNLSNFTLNGQSITTTYQEFVPGAYIILCPQEFEVQFQNYGTAIGLESWDVLTNSGEKIVLYDTQHGVAIDQLFYSLSWYNSSIKDDGGWSLELIDSENSCSSDDNWTASVDSNGGTPGKANSVRASKPDLSGPILEQVIAVSPDTLQLLFNENLDSLSILSATYSIGSVESIRVVFVSLKQVMLVLGQRLEASKTYTIKVDNLKDCSGNIITSESNSISFVLSETADAGDIVLNEVLFNPRYDGPDFVELYNNSEKYIDLQNWIVANKNDQGELGSMKIISETPTVMAPNSYKVLTTNVDALANEYPAGKSETFIEMGLPTFANDKGSVVILLMDTSVYEELDYNENFHHSLLSSVEGISLERIDVEGTTNNSNNWHSAASGVRATPGYINSQAKGAVNGEAIITISPKIFIPDQDGVDDYATIHYEFNSPGVVVTIRIIDDRGRVVKSIIEGQTVPVSGNITWDGTTNNGSKARVGSYLVFVEAFDMNGNIKQHHKRVVIGSHW